jgi:ribonucleoside-diphosphate reductase alpha chain
MHSALEYDIFLRTMCWVHSLYQSISANTSYDPKNYAGGKVPMKAMLQDLLTAYKLGLKTLYYHNTRDHAGEVIESADIVEVVDVVDESCEGGACKYES